MKSVCRRNGFHSSFFLLPAKIPCPYISVYLPPFLTSLFLDFLFQVFSLRLYAARRLLKKLNNEQIQMIDIIRKTLYIFFVFSTFSVLIVYLLWNNVHIPYCVPDCKNCYRFHLFIFSLCSSLKNLLHLYRGLQLLQ